MMMEWDIKEIIEAQRLFFRSQQTKSVDFRLRQLKQLERLLKDHEEALIEALKQDLGKHSNESYMTEIGLLYHNLKEAQSSLKWWSRPKKVATPLFLMPAKSYITPSPYGSTLILSAYNYPLLLSLDPLIGAIAGGNVALVGLSEYTPHVNQVLFEVCPKYFSADYVSVFESNKERNTQILKERFDKIFFTGSTTVGQIVLEAASQHLTPVTLELGGKSPALVTGHADLNLAAERIIWGKLLNMGQTCIAPDYCLVDETMAEEFMSLLAHKITALYGENSQVSPDYGRIVNQRHFNRLQGILEKDASQIVLGGKIDKADLFIEPTIIQGTLASELGAMKEELFGPILPVLSYSRLDEALSYIEEREAPLAFYPFSNDKAEIQRIIDRTQFGGATINDTILHLSNSQLPFGGVGHSGMGHYHGRYSFECFTHQRSVLERKTYLPLKLMYAPYTKIKDKWIRRFLK
ncbi:aldehyde dehydrogenase family protein [uncultured Vagococcus sp.]|uniref:aldehyde dehydrogenase family protein n=1 Tax=uncultured Vagococcus sp. TaxID=189676 RepID=UPI0028D14470|nr:aldehyde dehydrogenase family protein [uncultured Vagococcus sp.]